ncbi:MAG: hypothetical protein K0V04_01920 [Deltaproteobacteria bacterium]|nr:hypothetical protein [Deltaproteobacteria bacterium]
MAFLNRTSQPRPPWVLFFVTAGLAAGLSLVGGGLACSVQSIFTCSTNEDCVEEGGDGGQCQANNQCTFPDLSCESGQRWHDRAIEALAGTCFDPTDVGGTATGGGSGSSGGASSGGTGGGATSMGSTSLPGNDTSDPDSSDGPPPMTDDGTSTGAMGTCDEIFGGVADYELCLETAESCQFNVTLNQTTCDDLCGMFGSMMCITAFTNSAGDCASMEGAVPCSEVANDNICECAK